MESKSVIFVSILQPWLKLDKTQGFCWFKHSKILNNYKTNWNVSWLLKLFNLGTTNYIVKWPNHWNVEYIINISRHILLMYSTFFLMFKTLIYYVTSRLRVTVGLILFFFFFVPVNLVIIRYYIITKLFNLSFEISVNKNYVIFQWDLNVLYYWIQ